MRELQSCLRVGLVALNEAVVELPAESWSSRQFHLAINQLRSIDYEIPPDRIALGVKHLEVRAMRLAGQQVRCDLGLLVMSELDRVGVRDGRHPEPVGCSAGPGGIEVADIDRARLHQFAAGGWRVLALAGADGDPSSGS